MKFKSINYLILKNYKDFLLVLALFNCSTISAQNKNNNPISLNSFSGYATENNYGNEAFFIGITASKNIYKRSTLETGLTRFTTDIYNVYKTRNKHFDEEERSFNSWFLTLAAGYRLFGRTDSRFSGSIKAGPALKYFNYKLLEQVFIKTYSDGRREIIPGSLSYYEDKGFNISAYGGISFDTRISKKLRGGIVLDTYSHEIALEHTMLGIQLAYKLHNKTVTTSRD